MNGYGDVMMEDETGEVRYTREEWLAMQKAQQEERREEIDFERYGGNLPKITMEREKHVDWSHNRMIPDSDLEMQYATINPQWGESEGVSINLQKMMTKPIMRIIPKGVLMQKSLLSGNADDEGVVRAPYDVKYVQEEALWEQLDYLTRDLRLANIDPDEYRYCSHMLDLAMDCLRMGYVEASQMSIQRSAVRLELSQSKKGFLRKMMQTFIRQESRKDMTENNSILAMAKRKKKENW